VRIFWRWVLACGIGIGGWLGDQGRAAEETFQPLPADWKPTPDLRPLMAAKVTASSSFMGAEGPYAPERAVDGDRRTKWVGADQPSPQSPQWIVLELLGEEEVVGLALFGEPPNNDGVLDAQVQVAKPDSDEFVTVAAIRDAGVPAWRVKFPPTKTKKVRLLITRSGGPTTHTDVFEILLLGRPLSPAEMKAQTEQQWRLCLESIQKMKETLNQLPSAGDLIPSIQRDVESLEAEAKALKERFAQWDSLEAETQTELVQQIHRLAVQCRGSWVRGVEEAAAVWPKRLEAIQSARRAVQAASGAEKTAVSREGKTIQMINKHLLLRFHEPENLWEAVWATPLQGAVWGARMAVEVDGQTLTLEGGQTEIQPVSDKLGSGMAIRQRWGTDLVVEREITLYDGLPAVVLTGRIINRSGREASLGVVRLLELAEGQGGWWYAGDPIRAPGGVWVAGLAELTCEPIPQQIGIQRDYTGTQVLALAHPAPAGALVLGYLTGLEACPEVQARFQTGRAGVGLTARERLLGRRLPAGQTLELDGVYVAACPNIYEALERYGDAVAAVSRLPVRKGPTSLWCSWYAHRMAMTEELVLANAAVAARHFKPLGLQIIQLDHGWQRGDITGDWIVNERFSHGLPWLAEQLKTRYGFQLGVWISPTDVAETSQTFKDHPDWMLKDAEGRPRINWRWYWKPNPNCYELDASHPEAERFIRETFSRLSSEGVRYYKIDFISSCGQDHFVQHDPKVTRGWGVLRRAMEAVREGAEPQAWIRYCQTPPLLSVGLADSAYGGPDTLDAGVESRMEVLRHNARILAASYWINDRLYHREVCDMSARMQGAVEETRMALAMMALAGCSISLSDEFQYLPPSRIRMIQQVLPPGVPPMRPLDLLERSIPSVWHLHCKTEADEWDVVGLFNFENRPEQRTVELARLGRKPDEPVVAFEFWEEKLLGIVRERLRVAMPPQSSRIVLLRRFTGRPQLVGTNLHILGGWHELKRLDWDPKKRVLSGRYERAPGLEGKAFFYVPSEYRPHFEFPLNAASARLTNVGGGLWMQEIQFQQAHYDWSIPFDGPETNASPPREPNLTQ